jgi:hypothetical protein
MTAVGTAPQLFNSDLLVENMTSKRTYRTARELRDCQASQNRERSVGVLAQQRRRRRRRRRRQYVEMQITMLLALLLPFGNI